MVKIKNTRISINKGFTLIELMLTLAIVTILTSVTYSSYIDAIERARVNTAIADITHLEVLIERFFTDNAVYPTNLNNFNDITDPWGNTYRYLNMEGVRGNGPKRKDRNLVPLNSDYDLYSIGADGQTATALTAAISQDDIIRANNGGFIGKGEDY